MQKAALLNEATVDHVMSKQDKQIRGITTLDSQLFIVREGSQEIDVYNTSDLSRETGHVTVSDMMNPCSLVACSHYNCLCVSDWTDTGYIHRVELFKILKGFNKVDYKHFFSCCIRQYSNCYPV